MTAPRSLTQHPLLVAEAYCEAQAVTLSVASKRSCGDGRVLPGLADGTKSCTLATADHMLAWFSANWPEGVAWPAGVPRPAGVQHGEGSP